MATASGAGGGAEAGADATHACVTRWGQGAAPAGQAFGEGSDGLVIDTHKPAIARSIPMPVMGGLPPRPASLLQVGGTVVVVLQRTSADGLTVGDAVLVGLEREAIAWQLAVAGQKRCDHPALSPSGRAPALACAGPLGCGDVCLMADADVGTLRRWTLGGGDIGPWPDVTVDPATALAPVSLGGYRAMRARAWSQAAGQRRGAPR